jgi:hypothetical protein
MKASQSGMVGSLPTPECFRAQATGIGQTREASERTGLQRSQAVINCAPPRQRRNHAANGYPGPVDLSIPGY